MVQRKANGNFNIFLLQYLGQIGKPAELKHIIKRRKRNQLVIPLVLANEQGIARHHNHQWMSCNLEFHIDLSHFRLNNWLELPILYKGLRG